MSELETNDLTTRVWNNPKHALDRTTNELLLEEISSNILSSFARRRDLIYQVASIITIASALKWVSGELHVKVPGDEGRFLVAFFLFAASFVFQIRFSLIHANAQYYCGLFAILETKYYKHSATKEEKTKLAPEQWKFTLLGLVPQETRWRWGGVSALAIVFFSLLSGEAASILVGVYIDDWPSRVVAFGITTSLLIIIAVILHGGAVSRLTKKLPIYIKDPGLASATDAGLRTHYLNSMAETYLHMMCVTALVSIVALSSFSVMFGYIAPESSDITSNTPSMNSPTTPVGIYATSSALLALISVLMYLRLFRSLKKYQVKLAMQGDDMRGYSRADSLLGFVVVSVFFALSVGLATFSWASQFNFEAANKFALATSAVAFLACFCWAFWGKLVFWRQ